MIITIDAFNRLMKQIIDFSLQLTQQMLRLCSRIEPLINSQINTI